MNPFHAINFAPWRRAVKLHGMNGAANAIPGYDFGSPTLPPSPVTMAELSALKNSAGFTDEDQQMLFLAADVLASQAQRIVAHWRSEIIASIAHLARHSRSPDNQPLPQYLARSNQRFAQWIIDTCRRPYDQAWLNYQIEIARRHTTEKKNRTDGVVSTPFVPFRDIIAFTAVMNQTIRPYLENGGHAPPLVEKMHQAWCKSLQLQIALWGLIYATAGSSQW